MAWLSGNPWFTCDRCSQKRRRSALRKEWTGLVVCPPCLDPRPAELEAPNVYPEGLPLPDSRPPPAPIFAQPEPVWFINDYGLPLPFSGTGNINWESG